MENQTVLLAILGASIAISEALSFIPKVKSNGVFQLIVNILKTIAGKGK